MRNASVIITLVLGMAMATVTLAQEPSKSQSSRAFASAGSARGPTPSVTALTSRAYLSVEWRLLEAGTDELAETLEEGHEYDVAVTVIPDRQEGVKINPLFRTQEVKLEIKDERVKHAAEPRTHKEKRNPKARTVLLDSGSGSVKFRITLASGEQLATRDVELKLIADLVVCDEKGTYCAKTREEALLTLPSGRDNMKVLPLRYGAGNKERIILKVGDVAPDFTTANAEQQPVRLSEYRGKKNVVLAFGRGHW